MNRSIIVRPLASAAVLVLVAVAQPGFAALSQAASQLQRPSQALPARVSGVLVTLHRAQRSADLAVANGTLYPLRFTSLAQEQRLRVGSRLIVSSDARSQVRLLVRALRTQGVSTRAHIRGVVGRRLSRDAIEVLGQTGAAVVIHLGHARVTRVHRAAGLFSTTSASADSGPTIAPGEEIDTAVTLTGAGAVATGTATVAAPPSVQVEVEGLITAINPAAGTITVQDDDGPSTVVAVGTTTGTYHVGQEVEVVGTPTGAGGSAATVQAQFIRPEQPEAAEGVPAAAAPGTTIKVDGLITAVNAAAGTITVQDDDGGPATVVSVSAAGTFYVGQEVKVYGIVTSAGSTGATVRAQYISVDRPDADGGDDDGD